MATSDTLPFGEIQGYCNAGIPAYSNKHDLYFSGERSIDGNLFCGFKYQCVEFARRWLFERKQLVLPEVNWAVHIFQLKTVFDARTAEPVRCKAVRNGTAQKPVVDSLLIYSSSEDNVVGHVAVITEVGDNWVRIADQNHRFHKWEGDYAAQIVLKHEDGLWKIEDHVDYESHPLYPLGWVTFPDTPNRDPSTPLALHESLYFKQPEKPYFRRITFKPKSVKENWLDLSDEAEEVFAKTYGLDVTRSRLGEGEASYYQMNSELCLRCIQYGNELHNIFLEATKQVIESDERLRVFGIPEELWPRLRYSWKTQPNAISGRFDFAFDEKNQLFKCFEYNADSASALLECATIQSKWAESVGIADGTTRSSGSSMDDRMKFAWEQSGATGRVHFLIDDDKEETYTAMYVMKNARAVGLEAKLCVLFDEFHFDDCGTIYDSDGVEVTAVWKTWMWETAFGDYKTAQAERGKDWKPTSKDKVRLSDIVLGQNWDIKVYEPMWKVIPSNKAILPIVYANHPEHPALLRSSYELTEELRKTGYAKKPIVGRVGRNVTITEPSGVVAAESGGNFGDRDVIYQELFRLPEMDGYYAILGGWIIGDVYSGTGIREDKTLITGLESPFSALRIFVGKLSKPLSHEDLDREEEECDK